VNQPIFASFLQAGFECSTHVLANGRRLDLVSSTRHDDFAVKDFRAVQRYGMKTVREGIRWHLIERVSSNFDFSSAHTIHRAAKETGTEAIWDLLHFGWPDHLDVFSPEFPERFGRFAREFIRFLTSESDQMPFLAPINEISFLSFGGGENGFLNPFARRRGPELKRQLVRAAIEAIEAIWSVTRNVRLVFPEPVIHIAPNPALPGDVEDAERYRVSMFEAWDMLSGRMNPELGGKPEYLDIIGVNFYDRNQWVHFGRTLERGDPEYRPFREILGEVYNRYQRPVFVSETGTEDEKRPEWFNYIVAEVIAAMHRDIRMEGICLYPIVNHPGWNDNRHCYNGLFDYPNESGERQVYKPLAQAVLKANGVLQENFEENTYENNNQSVQR
jgi:hypothetical protein